MQISNKRIETCPRKLREVRAFVDSIESPLLRVGLHFLPRATLIFCVDVVPAPRYGPAVARRGSGGLKCYGV